MVDRHRWDEVGQFAKSALSKQKGFSFVVLGLMIVLLPGSNRYLALRLTPDNSQIQSIAYTLPQPSKYPVPSGENTPPVISARSAIVVDGNSKSVLYEKNSQEKLYPASTTKIMTALVAIEKFSLDEMVVVQRADRAIGQTMNLIPGEKMKVHDLLYGLLLESGNDAAFALAENFPGGYPEFVAEMNRRATELHLFDTQYRNVSGVEQAGHHTTAADLARLSAEAMKNPVFAGIVATRSRVVTDVSGSLIHPLRNKNELLGAVAGVRGIKTGWTELSGECLVTDTVRDGNEIIVVVLGSSDRFGDSAALIEWSFNAHEWLDPQSGTY